MIILFRNVNEHATEHAIANKNCKFLQTTVSRCKCKKELVIGRFSVLPYYLELENDLYQNECNLINNYNQHSWIADFNYYEDLKEYTFESWRREDFIKNCKYEGPFIVKGTTNSKKFYWNSLMFAKNKAEALEISYKLMPFEEIYNQGIIFRKYVPLETYEQT